ncbi:c-type cytochrome [Hoeflea prorocentri]|uniref:Cytochrome c family protein n=1 Tax=Hoeflea prorocentri TaxID=1922333 RepID=A0A9X3UJC3_9HYPH|nr:cytochrome c family protein [Hoeflea prorocentri]MCY6380179.1 cytochrome c family protein [Hoeflea prorocentri]MDA5397979.1 cytochrome c family protein [Hoeflea prorocentri]
MSILKTVIASVALAVLATPAFADGDADAGKKVFRKCKACHAVGDGAKNKVGPHLNGIVDNEIASIEDFKYSAIFIEKKGEGFVWTVEELDGYLEKPKTYLPGNKMSFAGLKKEKDRQNVIAYLKTFE